MIFRKHYLDEDVLTAVRKRFDRILEEFDDGYVAFSGGKDSLVCLHLMKEAFERHGRPFPLKASFLDEELIPDSVVNFVDGYRRQEWLKLLWFAFPLESNKFRLGKVETYIQWDPHRPHVRQIPEWAIRPAPGQRGPFSQYNMMQEIAKFCRGRIANITGIRAEESMNRYCSVAHRTVDNWLAPTEHPAVVHCKPIYDWTEQDVFKYLGEQGIPYCGLYDAQLYARTPFRVSTPIHTGSAKRLEVWRRMDPDFYERVTAVFPEMLAQERYYSQLGTEQENTIEALEEWSQANVPESKLPQVMTSIHMLVKEIEKAPLTEAQWRECWNKLENGTWLKGTRNLIERRRRKRTR